jgi:hypothetical protein
VVLAGMAPGGRPAGGRFISAMGVGPTETPPG